MSQAQFLRTAAIGDRLKEARLEAGMTVLGLSQACSIPAALWDRFEAGGHIPAHVLSMASAYGVDVLYVLTGFRLTPQQINDMDAINTRTN